MPENVVSAVEANRAESAQAQIDLVVALDTSFKIPSLTANSRHNYLSCVPSIVPFSRYPRKNWLNTRLRKLNFSWSQKPNQLIISRIEQIQEHKTQLINVLRA